MNPPVRYDPSVEKAQPDEREVMERLDASFQGIQETTARDYGRGVRAAHAKAHAVATGSLTVHDDLPAELAQGLFARPGRYDAAIRLSPNSGDIRDDAIALPRGFALKVMGVAGERLPGSEDERTQDFIMVDGPVFTAPDARTFHTAIALLARTTDRGEAAKKLASRILRGAAAVTEAVGVPSAKLQQLGGSPQLHPLGETYYSQTAFRHGDYIAKYSVAPVSSGLMRLIGRKVDIGGRPDALREEINAVLVEEGGRWELRVQLCRDIGRMPVEDPTVLWDEEPSPFAAVATLHVPPQHGWEHGRSEALDEALAFSIWRGLAAHRPLGNVNRARNAPYRRSAEFRGRMNGCPMREPSALTDLPVAATRGP